MGLTEFEYKKILLLLDREPTLTELGMFAVMWSEHCGYKYSRKVLESFKDYKKAVEGEGLENAGVVAIGEGLGITFKVESHNHPSAVEPYQGAATGVGGIIRDVLTMGARPIALLNSLRFGSLRPEGVSEEVAARNRYLFEHVVAGIAGYGNCVGVPTVGGEVGFQKTYSGNPLVNAMCVGLIELSQVTTAAAKNVGDAVIYLGSATGKDGIHGATFASDELDEESESRRPNVQIGDPFAEKLLIEATLEALATGAISAIQDMGAAGLTCSTIEMASKGLTGMEVDLDLVPMRESDMSAYELMLSESQERMLATAPLDQAQKVIDVFKKWGLPAKIIGRVIEERVVRVKRFDKIEAELDPLWLTNECPAYDVIPVKPLAVSNAERYELPKLDDRDLVSDFIKLQSQEETASKNWVYRQYDQQVQTQTQFSSGMADAAVMTPRGAKKAIALTLDCNSLQVRLDPYAGAWNAVHEAARNLACTGAKPVATTDGLNFGNPQNPEVFWEFKHAVHGIADACEAVNAPVLSGNVSFYNRSEWGEIPPTPIIGMAGILESPLHAMPIGPRLVESESNDETVLLFVAPEESMKAWHQDSLGGLGASLYLAQILETEDGKPIIANAEGEKKLRSFLIELAESRLALGCHDVSEGGLAQSLLEIALNAKLGMKIDLSLIGSQLSNVSILFGEPPGIVIVTALKSNVEKILGLGNAKLLHLAEIGHIGGFDFTIKINDKEFSWNLEELAFGHEFCIEKILS